MVMFSNHLQDVSENELAIVRKFSKRYRNTQSSIMTIGELLGDPRESGGRDCESAQREAIDKLMSRGWLVTNSLLSWDRRSDCILLGEGLNLARRLARDGGIPHQFARQRAAPREHDIPPRLRPRVAWMSPRQQ